MLTFRLADLPLIRSRAVFQQTFFAKVMTANEYSDRRLEFFQANRILYLVLHYVRHAYVRNTPMILKQTNSIQ